ncbi:hypothetical protein ILYODFUR_012707, partial [Ilyodon furcidens]
MQEKGAAGLLEDNKRQMRHTVADRLSLEDSKQTEREEKLWRKPFPVWRWRLHIGLDGRQPSRLAVSLQFH